MKRRSVYLYKGDDDFYSAMFQVGATSGPERKVRAYHPGKASALRLSRQMECILSSKRFWFASVKPRSLTIHFH